MEKVKKFSEWLQEATNDQRYMSDKHRQTLMGTLEVELKRAAEYYEDQHLRKVRMFQEQVAGTVYQQYMTQAHPGQRHHQASEEEMTRNVRAMYSKAMEDKLMELSKQPNEFFGGPKVVANAKFDPSWQA